MTKIPEKYYSYGLNTARDYTCNVVPVLLRGADFQLDTAFIDPDGEGGQRLPGRRRQGRAGTYTKAGAVAGADDLVPIDEFSRIQAAAQQG